MPAFARSKSLLVDKKIESELWLVVVMWVMVWINVLMLFPTQPLTHSKTSPLAEREKEPEKNRKKALNNTTDLHFATSISPNEKRNQRKNLFIERHSIHTFLLFFPHLFFLPLLCFSIVNVLAWQRGKSSKWKSHHFTLIYLMKNVFCHLQIDSQRVWGSIL